MAVWEQAVYGLLCSAVVSQTIVMMVGWLVNDDELERILKEEVVAKLKYYLGIYIY